MARKVLVVEDDPSILELFVIVLKEQGFGVHVCTNGKDAFFLAKRYLPSLILLDLWIPDLSGEEVTRILKANPETSHIPVVIVSAQNNLPQIVKRIGADAYLSKPFDLDQLIVLTQKFAHQNRH
ncbi:MAG: response regulator [bacterium]|nr:response regulator [bacterium]